MKGKKWCITKKEVEVLAAFVHGFLFFGNLLAVAFHLKRKKAGHALAHGAFAVYDLGAIVAHLGDEE